MTETEIRRPPTPSKAVASYVDRRIAALLHTIDTPTTRATLARLRASVGREPGEVPEIWAVTIDGAPGQPHGDAPTAEERAIHIAMTTFALHQQSRSKPMHVPSRGLGQAIRILDQAGGDRDAATSPVRRRFDALATASSLAEAAHHLRGLIGQLRSNGDGVGIDYGSLAADLFDLQFPERAAAVRLRWARQYYRLPGASAETSALGADAVPVAGTDQQGEKTR